MRRAMNTSGYTKYEGTDIEIPFPTVILRDIGTVTRNIKPIEGYKAVCDPVNNVVYAIVSNGYKLVQHQEALDVVDNICKMHPEWGAYERTVYLSQNGARKKATYRFPEIEFEITKEDVVNPTIEIFSSFDTTLAQVITLGGYRLVCSNGMIVGKILAEYKRKHMTGLNLDIAAETINIGMENYSNVAELWKKYTDRIAHKAEYTLFEELPFHKNEKERILTEMHKQGRVIEWDINEEGEKVRNAEINAWNMLNILTKEATHNITDMARQTTILTKVQQGFGK